VTSGGKLMLRFDRKNGNGDGVYTVRYTLTVNGLTSAPATVTVRVRFGSC
jgi:hypothetical protein